MPIYEYTCPKCGETVQYIKLRSTDEEPRVCRNCGDLLKKDTSAPAIAKLKTPAYGVL